MRIATLTTAIALTLITAGCKENSLRLAGSRWVSVKTGSLVTEYRQTREGKVAWLHVLLVPEVVNPGGGSSYAMGSGRTRERYKLDYHYYETSSGISIHAPPITADGINVSGGGRSFDMGQGNVFVARVNRRSVMELSQVRRHLRDPGVFPEAVLGEIKAAFPNDSRIQALQVQQ